MSTLYPFIKSLPDDDERKIFYATAKSSGKENAHKALMILKERGLELGHIVLTSKEKICFCKDKACNPDECLYAKGYYNKIKGVLKHCLLHESTFTYPNIVDTAYKYEICPFEFELDLSNFLDVIICDYNYIYDPISYLKRFFDADASHHLALVDEAHNLVSRSQDMYSAELLENEYLLCKKSLTHVSNRKLKTSLSIFKDLFAFYKEEEIKNPLIIDFIDEKYHKGIDKFLDVVADTLKDYPKDVTKELMNFYLNVHRFRKIGELFNQDNFIIYIYQKDDGTLSIKYFCLNPSKYLRSISNSMKAVIYFSATLSPTTYYVDTLGGDKEKDPILKLSSPFPRNNLKLLIAPKLSIKYRNRDKSYQQVAEYIKEFVSHKVGNYLVYLPSYEYLNQLKPLISDESIDFIYQTRDMNEQDRLAFLSNFIEDPQKTVVGFAIIGGSFGEGIDLVSDRLIGVVIVGIGLPKINFESDCVAEYFNNENINGHHYAYLYPGFNKVQQAVGRVIRSETDKGSALLIDERYMSSELQDLYRYEWKNYQVVFSTDDIKNHLQDIFKTK